MTYPLYLAHINDTHSHFDASLLHFHIQLDGKNYQIDAHCGGYARLASAIKQQRKQAQQQGCPSLLLHAGDSFQGSLYFSQYKGAANARLLDLLAPDAMTIGNHEFDLGNTPISHFIDQVSFPVLAGNMDLSTEDQRKPLPLAGHNNLYPYLAKQQRASYLLKELAEGVQLAIIGITHDQMHNIGCPDPDCQFVDAISCTQATVKHLHQQGIKHIIVLSHLGYQGDVALATAVPGISVIVGGHSHTLSGDFRHLGFPEGAMGQFWHQGCLILHAGKHAESIGLSHLEFDADGSVVKFQGGVQFLLGKQWHARQNEDLVSAKTKARIAEYLAQSGGLRYQAEDQQIQQIISQDYRPAIDAMRQQVICQVARPLAHTRLPTKLLPQGSEISPLVCQGFYQAAAVKRHTDFALHNAGGVRVSLKAGPLTKADICGRLLPFEIAIVSYQLEGKYLAPLIEGAINNATNNGVQGTGDGSFPYFYKLRYHYNSQAKLGHRVTQIELLGDAGWQPLDPRRHYRGVSSAYTLAGKEGYHALLNSDDHQDLGMSMSDSFVVFAEQLDSLG